MMKKWITNLMLAVLIVAASACAPAAVDPAPTPQPETPAAEQPAAPSPVPPGREPSAPSAGIQFVRSELARQDPGESTPGRLEELVGGNSRFALDLYQRLKAEDGNLFYSPYSISLALALAYAGAEGDTAAQMAEVLGFPLPAEDLHLAFNALDQSLAERGQRGEEPDSFRLNIVNSLWGQQGYPFREEYLDLLALHYGAGLNLLDFIQRAEDSRQLINEWVSEQTEERIQDLLPPGTVDSETRLVLVNAIYFNAAWAQPFEERDTRPGSFFLLDGSQIQTPMMQQTANFSYGRGQGYQVIELPYEGYELAMTILLPDAGQFQEFEAGLDQAELTRALELLGPAHLQLAMPSFSYDSSFSLAEQLKVLGMPAAFQEGEADFSAIDGTRDLFIKDVVHKSFIAVDEEGTEAAAATGVVMGITSMPAETLEVTIDRPFIYLIRDLETGTILFLGRMVNPGG
jgi:serpin B